MEGSAVLSKQRLAKPKTPKRRAKRFVQYTWQDIAGCQGVIRGPLEIIDPIPTDNQSCRALMAAIILQAIRDLGRNPARLRAQMARFRRLGYRSSYERVRDTLVGHYEARRWLSSNSTEEWSYLWLCERLDIRDPREPLWRRGAHLRLVWRRDRTKKNF